MLRRGDQVGRYIVIALVGRGGMGEVYAAYDPELDRKIALKLLRADREGPEGRTRILREAQAIAKLSHPNVVGVYDVGTHGDGVFIAMEFVEGQTVAAWIADERPSWREILAAFVAAGRGLQAAHEAGIIHRDFKPENVLIGRDGKVRVADFGLARLIDDDAGAGAGRPAEQPPLASAHPPDADTIPLSTEADTLRLRPAEGGRPARDPGRDGEPPDGAPPSPSPSPSAAHPSVHFLNVAITRAGVVVGTPVYMAPEHLADLPLDARSDQFSYCVALYGALYGVRPFSDSAPARQAEILANEVRAPPPSPVPGWVRRAIARGLRARPDERWPAMGALLSALESDPAVARRRRLRAVGGAAAAAGLVAALAGVWRPVAPAGPACGDGGARVTAVWPVEPADPRRAALRAAFVKTGPGYAAETFAGAARLVDAYAAGWKRMYRDACEAHARGEQSAEVLDLRMGCLDERLAAVGALGRVLAGANETVVANAIDAAAALPALERCADVPLLRAVIRPPDDPRLRERARALGNQVTGAAALVDSGQCQAARARMGPLLADVRAAGHSPLSARALTVAGKLEDICGDFRRAERPLKSALWEAEAGHDDEQVAEVATLLAATAGEQHASGEAAEDWANLADAALRRIGNHEILQSWLLVSRGIMADEAGDYDRALSFFRRSLDIKERLLGPDNLDTLRSASDVAETLANLGRYQEAEPLSRRVVAATEAIVGQTHPLVARALINHAEVLEELGRAAEAKAAAARAIDLSGPDQANARALALARAVLGESALALGRAREARAVLEQALAASEEAALQPAELAELRFALARALWATAPERPRALGLAQAARVAYARAPGRGPKLAAVDAWVAARRRP
jgi:serine/threonine protein kinase/tetratricopeptide (TPR) repeat protein